ncbi:MAG: LTA synthase family protein, partial [Nitrosomonadales bacterium]|nr:LTA synthase family protein [Nitrosomonadales bacterium]
KPGRYERLVSQIDVPPTLLDLLGVAGSDQFFGQNMFTDTQNSPRTFISNYQSLGYYKNDQLIVLSPKQVVEAYRIDPVTYEAEVTSADPQLVKEAIAYYQTASNAFKDGGLKELPVVAATSIIEPDPMAN